ncbi:MULTISPECIES: hypothetical protein [Calothrix]|nr:MULTISPECIES: hypothetical protein [Calothrix]
MPNFLVSKNVTIPIFDLSNVTVGIHKSYLFNWCQFGRIVQIS